MRVEPQQRNAHPTEDQRWKHESPDFSRGENQKHPHKLLLRPEAIQSVINRMVRVKSKGLSYQAAFLVSFSVTKVRSLQL